MQTGTGFALICAACDTVAQPHLPSGDLMLIKPIDDKSAALAALEQLLKRNGLSESQRQAIDNEIRTMRAELKGEQESAYLIDFDFKDSKNTAVIHDLRLDINGRVTHIDHLLIHRTLTVFVLETKFFNSGMKITEEGEFLRWNSYKRTFEGMASPFAQNERHITVLKDAFSEIEMPSRLGMRLSPSFVSYVLVAPSARIDRPKKFDTRRIIKSDILLQTIEKKFGAGGFLDTLGRTAKFVASETVEDSARKLVSLHRPAAIDYVAKFGLPPLFHAPQAAPLSDTAEADAPAGYGKHKCRNCGSSDLSIQYGKLGYYFKCGACESNTPIKIGCAKPRHQERIRQDGLNFFRECAECGTSSLFFQNTEPMDEFEKLKQDIDRVASQFLGRWSTTDRSIRLVTLRDSLIREGIQLSVDDEAIIERFINGSCTFDELARHFVGRMP